MTPRMVLHPTNPGRLAIQCGVALTIAMIAIGLIGFSIADAWVSHRIDTSLRHHAAKYLAPANGKPVTRAAVKAKILDWQNRKILSERTYVLFDGDGRRLAGRLDIAPPRPGFTNVQFLGGGHVLQTGRALARRLPDGAMLVIVQHSEAAASLHHLLPLVVIAIALAAVVMGVSATFLFAHLTAKRLAETQRVADSIAAGDLSRRIATDRLDGMFAEQAESLNRMLDRMEDLVKAQRLFSSNLAHDLRTPLTRLGSLLAQGSSDPALLERAERECASIIGIFDALLRLAEIETGRHPSAMRPLSLRPLIEDAAETMEPVIADHGGRLEVRLGEDVAVTGDADLINQLLINLLENVATHTPAGTCATLSLETSEDSAVITLRDDGPGLPHQDLDRVVRPFERGATLSPARGSGLGLAIAHAIARFHAGELDLTDAAPGLRVRIRLPAVPAVNASARACSVAA